MASQAFSVDLAKATPQLSTQALLGTWHLVHFVEDPFGTNVSGMLEYVADGSMIVVWGRTNRPVPKNPSAPTDAELTTMVGNFDAYWGTFAVDPKLSKVIHHVKGALAPYVVGTDRIRTAILANDQLTLIVPPTECRWDLADFCAPSEMIQLHLVWRREPIAK